MTKLEQFAKLLLRKTLSGEFKWEQAKTNGGALFLLSMEGRQFGLVKILDNKAYSRIDLALMENHMSVYVFPTFPEWQQIYEKLTEQPPPPKEIMDWIELVLKSKPPIAP